MALILFSASEFHLPLNQRFYTRLFRRHHNTNYKQNAKKIIFYSKDFFNFTYKRTAYPPCY